MAMDLCLSLDPPLTSSKFSWLLYFLLFESKIDFLKWTVLNSVPIQTEVRSNPQRVTLLGNSVSADVVKLR